MFLAALFFFANSPANVAHSIRAGVFVMLWQSAELPAATVTLVKLQGLESGLIIPGRVALRAAIHVPVQFPRFGGGGIGGGGAGLGGAKQ